MVGSLYRNAGTKAAFQGTRHGIGALDVSNSLAARVMRRVQRPKHTVAQDQTMIPRSYQRRPQGSAAGLRRASSAHISMNGSGYNRKPAIGRQWTTSGDIIGAANLSGPIFNNLSKTSRDAMRYTQKFMNNVLNARQPSSGMTDLDSLY